MAWPRCSQRCRCQGGGVVECWPEACSQDEVCEVQDGLLGCYPRACGRCEVLGGISSTFDGHRLALGTNCTRALVEVEAEEPLAAFKVEVAKEGEGIRRVEVTAHGVTVVLAGGRQWEVMVDGVQHLLPLVLADGAVTVSQEGTHRVLLTQGGPKVLFDGVSYILVTLPSSYHQRPHGLCGDFNGDPHNDNPQEDTNSSTCTPDFLPTACPMDTPGLCGVLQEASGPFSGCHGVVEPHKYVVGCMQEQCKEPGGQAMCRSFQVYAAACQAAGGDLKDWRAAAKCPLSCPPHSHYSLCTQSCPLTCAAISMTPPCTRRCFEGCECDRGFLFNGGECVPMDSCGCLHRGRYFEIAETITSPDCTETCTCRAPGGLQCRPSLCPFGQVCGLIHGARACTEQPGRCSVAPATRFVSFDGATGATVANGVYVVASLCDPQGSAWFRLLAEVGEDPALPAVVALHLFSPRAFVTVKREKKVWVNGIPATFPVEVYGGLNITETHGTIWIRQPSLDIGFNPSGEVTVMVAQGLSGKLCGICGNYDGNAANDLQGPDGTLVGDVVALAKAWRAPDFTHCCI
ncbi:IgGFc-binding protein-like [Guaruba guarouba]